MKPHQPMYQTKGLVTSYRIVIGFGWVGAAAAEICGFSGLLEIPDYLVVAIPVVRIDIDSFTLTRWF